MFPARNASALSLLLKIWLSFLGDSIFDQKPLSQERKEEEVDAQQDSVSNFSSSPKQDADDGAALKDSTESGIIPEMQNPNPDAFSSDQVMEQEMIESDKSGS